MSLFDSASLVVTPNGYKATKLYSVIPSDGTGDMTFGRAGNTATRVNASGLIQAVNADIPRLDYFGGGCPKLLLEPQRTNLILQSQDISSASWLKANSPTIVSNSSISPDGTTNADSIQDTTGGSFKVIYQTFGITANSTYTFSLFVKKETSRTNFGGVAFYPTGGTAKQIYVAFNEVNGTLTNLSGGSITPTFKVDDYGNFYRFIITFTDNGTNNSLEIDIYGTISTNGTSLGLGAGSARTIWGMQLEAGPWATSYIPTTSAAVTRNADDCYKTGISSLIGQASGTLFIDYNFQQYDSSVKVLNVLGITDNDVSLTYISSNLRLLVTNNANIVINQNYAGFYNSGRYKIAFAYSLNNAALYINGTQVATFNNCSFNFTSAYRLSLTANNNFYGDFDLNSTALWKTRLSNADLAALTSL